ncbi:metal-dependent hydrolase [Metabacillus halosaccharovorans]|uniref:metal-dependent hydrolase n=1 Tax=Metabacillus halosaccharovorans TaxID=930124 RepID=UPI001C1F4D68|nr:metal-dependent hydrolase [Metabacillus halosaccharovorans]MBU7593209.1 metal-dependent hydrolase [Metabacillus halosaccharovorans]
MDTSTHITMGFGLAGLAYLDPNVSTNPELATAVMIGTVIGSNAPDFDYAIKILKGNGMYTEHHRGLSHSLPAMIIWPILIACIIFALFDQISFIPLLYWTSFAVILHVLFDIFNAYGTQAGRPFTKKWLSLNFIPLFDLFIILVHLIGFIFWLYQYPPGIIFFFCYIILSFYLIYRYIISLRIKTMLAKDHPIANYTVIPTLSIKKWDFVIETDDYFKTGRVKKRDVNWNHSFRKHDPSCAYIQSSLKDCNVKHFLANSKHTHALYVERQNGFEVRWFDLRFRQNHHYPYMALVLLDKDLQIVTSYTGWIHQSRYTHKKMIPTPDRNIELK